MNKYHACITSQLGLVYFISYNVSLLCLRLDHMQTKLECKPRRMSLAKSIRPFHTAELFRHETNIQTARGHLTVGTNCCFHPKRLSRKDINQQLVSLVPLLASVYISHIDDGYVRGDHTQIKGSTFVR